MTESELVPETTTDLESWLEAIKFDNAGLEGWLKEISNASLDDDVLSIKQNTTVQVHTETDEGADAKSREIYSKINKFLNEAQSENGPFEVTYELKDNEETVNISVDPWTVGAVSLDFEGGLKAIQEDSNDPVELTNPHRSVHIEPKIDDTDWFAMLALSMDWNIEDMETRDADIAPNDFAGFIAYAYDNVLNELFTEYGGLRQKHRTVKRDLEAEIKGSVRISEYLTNITRGEVTTVPCSFSELTMDNHPNRTLLHALYGAQRLVQYHGTGSAELNRKLLRHRRKFATVTHEHIRPDQLDQLDSLPTAFEGYQESNALDVAKYIIEQGDLGINTGEFESIELTAKMWELFEDAFAHFVADEFEVEQDHIKQEEWKFSIKNNELEVSNKDGEEAYRRKEMRPDIYIPSNVVKDENDNNLPAIVADTKWKRVEPFFEEGKKISNSDLFQITTYCKVASQLEDNENAVGFLVYPYTDQNSESNGVPCYDFSLDRSEQSPDDNVLKDIYVIGWRVNTNEESDQTLCESASETVEKMRDCI